MTEPAHPHSIGQCHPECPAYDPDAWRCKCGAQVMLADTEDWPEPACVSCYEKKARAALGDAP